MGIFPSTNSVALNANTSSMDIPYFLLKSSLDRELATPPAGPVSVASLCGDKVQKSGTSFGAGPYINYALKYLYKLCINEWDMYKSPHINLV